MNCSTHFLSKISRQRSDYQVRFSSRQYLKRLVPGMICAKWFVYFERESLNCTLDAFTKSYCRYEIKDRGNCDVYLRSHRIQHVFQVFGDCVDTNLKLIGFIIGFISLFLWLLPLIPQLLHNYRTKRCDGLSIYFILFWYVLQTRIHYLLRKKI